MRLANFHRGFKASTFSIGRWLGTHRSIEWFRMAVEIPASIQIGYRYFSKFLWQGDWKSCLFPLDSALFRRIWCLWLELTANPDRKLNMRPKVVWEPDTCASSALDRAQDIAFDIQCDLSKFQSISHHWRQPWASENDPKTNIITCNPYFGQC